MNIQKRLRQLLNESADMPELVGKFSPEELKQMAKLEPYKNKFEKGTYHGKGSGDLNTNIDFARYSKNEFYGMVEELYKVTMKNIPEFKNFKQREHANEPLLEMNIEKNTKLEGVGDDDYSVKIGMHATWRDKNDDLMDYKKGQIWVLFTPNITVTRTHFDLNDIAQKRKRRAGTDMEGLMGDLQKKGYGNPDDEDKYYFEKLKVDTTVNSMDEYVKVVLPKVRENLIAFAKYCKNKYNVNVL
jgi:hypothetical protein